MRRLTRQLLMLAGMFAALLVLGACSGNPSVSTGIGIHRSSNGDWGHSINIGIHGHSRNW